MIVVCTFLFSCIVSQSCFAKKAEEEHRRLRHDVRYHLETIAEYAKTGDIPAILAISGNTVLRFRKQR